MQTLSFPIAKINGEQFLTDIADHLAEHTGHWFGPLHISGGLWRALRAGELKTVNIMWDGTTGLQVSHNILGEVVREINELGDARISRNRLEWSLSFAMRWMFGLNGGKLTICRRGRLLEFYPAAYGQREVRSLN